VSVPDPLIFLLMVDDLLDEQVTVIFLTKVLDLQLLVLLHQPSIVVVNLLSYLGHGLQMLIQLLFFLLIVILVVLLLLLLLS